MPYKNRIKQYANNHYYHIYARGANKMTIFNNEKDYKKFKLLLAKYLTPEFKERKIINGAVVYVPVNSVYGIVELNCYTLMENHFHMLCKNMATTGITELMRRILPTYARYFNARYNRTGSLIEGGYRAVLIKTEEQLIQTSRYIHLNPVKNKVVKKAKEYKHSSYHDYLRNRHRGWLTIDKLILKSTDYPNIERYLRDDVKKDYPF